MSAPAKPGKHIERMWLDYRAQALPAAAPSVQVSECRRAFYAGVWAFYSVLMNGFESGATETTADLNLMREIDAELTAFNDQVKRGLA